MYSLGIVHKHSIEMVDVTIRGGSIVPHHCPAEQQSLCDQCVYAHIVVPSVPDIPGTPRARPRHQNVSLVLCHWHERRHRS